MKDMPRVYLAPESLGLGKVRSVAHRVAHSVGKGGFVGVFHPKLWLIGKGEEESREARSQGRNQRCLGGRGDRDGGILAEV